jgi:hypothetical protein
LAADGRHVIVVDGRADVMQEDPATGRTPATLPDPRDLALGEFTYQTDLGEAVIDPADGLVATVDHLDELNFGWGIVTVRNLASRRTLASQYRAGGFANAVVRGPRPRNSAPTLRSAWDRGMFRLRRR